MADELGITGGSFVVRSADNVDRIERQGPVTPTPFRKAWSRVATLVARIYSILTFYQPTDLNLIWKLPLFLVGWIVIFPVYYISKNWKRVFIVSCIAISLDPLFLYIPIIDEGNQCLGMDKTLRNVMLILRSYIDIVFISHIIVMLSKDEMDGPKDSRDQDSQPSQDASCWPLKFFGDVIADKMSWLSFSLVNNCLAILPIPQVGILVLFFRMNGTELFLNFALLFQLVVRILQMYLSSKQVEKVANWIYGSFYFFLYILASHVSAAFWYFFSIQRVTSCWHQTCQNSGGCIHNYKCGGSTPNSNKLLNNSCSVGSSNATNFDFGMYIDILQSGSTGSMNFSKKFFYSFWWGLKNLSNFGTNLETSGNVWENCFAIVICINGLLLFLYLIGNVQLYIQMYMQTKAEKLAKTEEANLALIDKWMTSHDLCDEWRIEIRRLVVANRQVDIKFFLDRLWDVSYTFRNDVVGYVCRNALKKISVLQNMDERDLNQFTDGMDREAKAKDKHIIRAGEPLESMWFILDGVIESKCEDDHAETIMTLQTGDHYGVELLHWGVLNYKRSYWDPLPISPRTLTCQTDAIAFKCSYRSLIHALSALKDTEQLEVWALGHYSNFIVDDDPATTQEKDQVLLPLPIRTSCERGWLKLNCSSVWDLESKLAEQGWVLRDDAGAFIAAASIGPVSCMDKLFADALAVFRAIRFCYTTAAFSDSMRMTFRERESKVSVKIVVESDNQFLINLLNNIKGSMARCATTLESIIDHIVCDASSFEGVKFVCCDEHEYGNIEAHNIAKHAMHDVPGHLSEWHSTPPTWLTSALDHDTVREDSPAAADAFTREANMIKKKKKDIFNWLSRNRVPEHLKTDIMSSMNKDLFTVENNIDAQVDVEFMFSVLPKNTTKSLRCHLGMNSFKKVPMLKSMHEYVLEIICCHLEPVIYEENSFIVRDGEVLGFMIFILQGTIILTETTENITTANSSEITEGSDEKILEESSFYGEQLLSWASPNNISFSDHPVISTAHVKCGTKVEALILKAADLRSAAAKCGSQWNFNSSSDSKQLAGDDEMNRVADKSALAPTSTNNKQTIQLHQGNDMIMEQLVLIREAIFRKLDDQGRRLDDQGRRLDDQGRRLDKMAAFLATSGYKDTSRPPSP